jgi:hypothetical protein
MKFRQMFIILKIENLEKVKNYLINEESEKETEF